jgi:DNA polymerase-3 subunit alpha
VADTQSTETSPGSLPRKIWYGIEAIKGIGAKAVLAILAARERNGPFRSLFDLCERVEASSLNKTVLDSLIASGALDCFGQRRAQLAAVAEAALGRGARSQEDQQSGQRTLFDLFDSSAPGGEASTGRTEPKADGAYPDVPEWSEAERLLREKQTLGFYLSGHPLHAQKTLIQKFATHTLGRIPGLANGTSVCVGVLIAKLTKKVSKKNGEPFWIALVEDLEGSMEIFVSTQLHDASREWLVEERLVFLKGSVRFRDTNVSISVDEIVPLEEAPAKLTTDLSVVIPIHDGPQAEDAIFRLKGVLGGHRGSCPVFLVLRNGKGEIVVQVGRENYVAPGPGLLAEVETICGPDGYFVNRMQGR